MRDVVLFDKKEGVATVTLNRPDRLNAVTGELRARLRETLDDACKDDEVKVIIVTGAGRGFCAGADMEGLAATSEGRSQGEEIIAKEIMRQIMSKALMEALVIFPHYPNQLLLLLMDQLQALDLLWHFTVT